MAAGYDLGQDHRGDERQYQTPGMANIFWQPIQTRTEMLTTGFRSKVGIKIFGPDLGKIQEIGGQIEKVLSDFPATRSVMRSAPPAVTISILT